MNKIEINTYRKKKNRVITVRRLKSFLKKCNPNDKLYFTLGGSCNWAPLTYISKNEMNIEKNTGRILLGECDW
jgi:hypothetical protein